MRMCKKLWPTRFFVGWCCWEARNRFRSPIHMSAFSGSFMEYRLVFVICKISPRYFLFSFWPHSISPARRASTYWEKRRKLSKGKIQARSQVLSPTHALAPYGQVGERAWERGWRKALLTGCAALWIGRLGMNAWHEHRRRCHVNKSGK